MGFFGTLLGKPNASAKALIDEGAVIIDVRTPGEYRGGHVAGSKNIPLQEIQQKEKEIMKLNKPVVFCCASGARSGQATNFFKGKGLNCENGGPWTTVNNMV